MNNTQLSKWWQSRSAQAAWERAKEKRKSHNAERLAAMMAKRERIKKEAENWKAID